MTFPSDIGTQILLPFSLHANQWCMPRWLLCPCLWTSPSKQAKGNNQKKQERQQHMPTMCSKFQKCNDPPESGVQTYHHQVSVCHVPWKSLCPRKCQSVAKIATWVENKNTKKPELTFGKTNMVSCFNSWCFGPKKWSEKLQWAIWANHFHHKNSLMWHDHSTSFDLQIAYIQIDGCCEHKYVPIFESGTNERLISRL